MKAPKFEVIAMTPLPRTQTARRRWSPVAVAAGLAAVALAVSLNWIRVRQLESAMSELDQSALGQAVQTMDTAVERDRKQVAALAALLAEDTRVRTPLMMPKFDEATVRDVLDDLKRASGASMLAVLDVNGKVRAVAGAPALRELDFGASPLVRAALNQPGADVWTLPQGALVRGVAAVRSANQPLALVAVGFEVGAAVFADIERRLGVAGALVAGGRVVTTGTSDPGLRAAFTSVGELEEGAGRVVQVAGGQMLARASHSGSSSAATRLVWLMKEPHQLAATRQAQVLTWAPAALALLAFALGLLGARSRAGALA